MSPLLIGVIIFIFIFLASQTNTQKSVTVDTGAVSTASPNPNYLRSVGSWWSDRVGPLIITTVGSTTYKAVLLASPSDELLFELSPDSKYLTQTNGDSAYRIAVDVVGGDEHLSFDSNADDTTVLEFVRPTEVSNMDAVVGSWSTTPNGASMTIAKTGEGYTAYDQSHPTVPVMLVQNTAFRGGCLVQSGTSPVVICYDPLNDTLSIVVPGVTNSVTKYSRYVGSLVCPNCLLLGQTLWAGQSIVNADETAYLTMQLDGDLCLLNGTPNNAGTVLWRSGTANSGADRLTLTYGGNLTVSGGAPPTTKWETGTSGLCYLTLQNDKRLVLYSGAPQSTGLTKWSSPTI